jgi:hypothetical protein
VLDAPNGVLGEISGPLSFSGNSFDSFAVYPYWQGDSYCDVEEIMVDSAVEYDDDDCQGIVVTPGNGGSCVILNTIFFEGIPVLSRNGLIILALLMLSVGAVGLRRFT